jgi:transcriptional regulator with XRE-family HTH domain
MRIGELLYNWRFFAKLNVRDASALIGISPSSLSRIERGYIPDGAIMLTLMNWLFTKPEETHEAKAPAADTGN